MIQFCDMVNINKNKRYAIAPAALVCLAEVCRWENIRVEVLFVVGFLMILVETYYPDEEEEDGEEDDDRELTRKG